MRKFAYNKPLPTGETSIPSTVELEVQALADLANCPETFDEGRRILSEDTFSDDETRAAYIRLCRMADRGDSIDLVSFRAEVGNNLFQRILDIPSSSMLEAVSHFHALAKQARSRSVYTTCQELMSIVTGDKDAGREAEVFEKLDGLRRSSGQSWRTTVFDYSAEIPQPLPLLTCGGVVLATRENLTVITGRPKASKTTLQSAIIAAAITGRSFLNIEAPQPLRILLCDTEQSSYYLSRQCDRTLRLAGIGKELRDGFSVLKLRPYDPEERYTLISEAVEDTKPDVLFIDGAADLLADTNDLVSSERLVANLLTMSSKHDMGIVTIIHSNPSGDGKVRGHLGSVAERKAETVITLERDGMNDTITVKPRQTRNQPFKPFSFTLDGQGDPELVPPDNGPKTTEDWLLYLMEPGKEYKNSEIVIIMEAKGFKKSAVQYAVAESLKKGRLQREGNAYSIVLHPDDLPDI